MNQTQLLIIIAKKFLVADLEVEGYSGFSGNEVVNKIGLSFQKRLKEFYSGSDYAQEVRKLSRAKSSEAIDEQALNLLAGISGSDENSPQIASQLPIFHQQYPTAGFECTLATGMLRLALEDLGYTNTRSVLLKKHYLAIRELPDGSIKFYDAANRSTRNGRVFGFAHTFLAGEVVDRYFIPGNDIYTFNIKTKQQVVGTEMFSQQDDSGFYFKKFLAYGSETLIDLAVFLKNLSQYKDQTDEFSRALCQKYPELQTLDYQKLKSDLHLFDGYDYI